MREIQGCNLGLVATLFSTLAIVDARIFDRFNYGETDFQNGRDFGLEDWNQVDCDNPKRCLGFPDSWETAIGWDLENTNAECEVCTINEIENNNCRWCPEGSSDCGQHRQSPINLKRDRGLFNHPNEKRCPDWHWMKYRDGACAWNDLVDNDDSMHRNNFLIDRHALQILQPVDDDGVLQCFNETLGGRIYPKLDYSKGFPDWWNLHHTEISVPSEHTQEGVRYDAEVTLAHFYEIEHYKNQLGKVVIWLDGYDDTEPWPMLDKLICQWRETEEKVREDCGLDSVTTYYPGCTNYDRGHTPAPSAPPNLEPSSAPSVTTVPSSDPTTSPVTQSPTNEPTKVPSTAEPTSDPTPVPTTAVPTSEPTAAPSSDPTVTPTSETTQAEGNPTEASGSAAPRPNGSSSTFSPVLIVDTDPPTSKPTIGLRESCNICGASNLQVTNKTGLINMPAFYNFPCGTMESAGKVGLIDALVCPTVSLYVDDCNCEANDEITAEPVSFAPITSVPSLVPTLGPTLSPTLAPTLGPTLSPTLAPTLGPTLAPTPVPTLVPKPSFFGDLTRHPTAQPTIPTNAIPPEFDITMPWLWSFELPSAEETEPPVSAIPPLIDCANPDGDTTGIDLNYNRMCKVGSCCDPDKRSATDFCHDAYSFFGEQMDSVCYHCCEEPKIPAPAPPLHPIFPKIDCATVENPARMCKKEANSCCQLERSDTMFCQDVYQQFGDTIHSICWYCCEEPKEVGAEDAGSFRLLQLDSYKPIDSDLSRMNPTERKATLLKRIEKGGNEETKDINALQGSDSLSDTMLDRRQESTERQNENMHDDEEYFNELMKRHLLNENVIKEEERLVNYEDVSYWPYEWLLKVRTEYYFRYEGTQAVPPCKDQVHWRVMKDPIPVARRQIAELERLMAERIAPENSRFNECEPDNAGTVRPDTNGTKFDFARPTQEFHKVHRKVFCECKNWKSKFQEDKDWCERDIINRFYQHPYNFDFDTGIYTPLNSTDLM